MGVVARDLHRGVAEVHGGHLVQGHLLAARRVHEQAAQVLDAGAAHRVEAHHQIVAALALVDVPGHVARERGAQQRVQVADFEAVLRDFVAVVGHAHLRQGRDLLHLQVAHARQRPDEVGRLIGLLEEHLQVVAVNLDADVGLHARNQLVEAHLDGLLKLHAHARHVGQGLLHLVGQLHAGARAGPLAAVLEDNHLVGILERHGVGGDF